MMKREEEEKYELSQTKNRKNMLVISRLPLSSLSLLFFIAILVVTTLTGTTTTTTKNRHHVGVVLAIKTDIPSCLGYNSRFAASASVSSSCRSVNSHSTSWQRNPIVIGVRSALQTAGLPAAHASVSSTRQQEKRRRSSSFILSSTNGENSSSSKNGGGFPASKIVETTIQQRQQQRQQQGWRRRTNSGADKIVSDNIHLCAGDVTTTTNNVAERPVYTPERGGGEGRKASSSSSSPNHSLPGAKDTKLHEPTRGGGLPSSTYPSRPLAFWENMICGAISRSIAQTIMHPANTMKTILQSSRSDGGAEIMTLTRLVQPKNLKLLTRGAGAQFIMSVPHGAVNFAVLEFVRRKMNQLVTSGRFGGGAFGPGLDFMASAISTICCSVVSTPQMMITDNIMAGTYPNFPKAVTGLAAERGILGFYSGWWPGLAGKIPSYALTWTFFQQLKEAQLRIFKRPPKDIENSMMGCMASAATVCIMIPMDTIKTRLVTQANYPHLVPYKGIIDCAVRITKEEGIGVFYRGLTPRLVSVVPMIGIQFGVYEFMKKVMLSRTVPEPPLPKGRKKRAVISPEEEEEQRKLTTSRAFEEVAMEVAADDEQPFPAPQFKWKYGSHNNKSKSNKKGRKEKKMK